MTDEHSTELKKGEVSSTQKARSVTYIIFLGVLLLWLYTLWADRVTPMTEHARVNTNVIRIAPEVSGPIAAVNIRNNASVTFGQPLLTIDKQPFELAVKATKLALLQAGQSYQADSAAINVAKANEVAARVKLNNVKRHVARNRVLVEKGTISQAAMDDSLADLQSAQANLDQAVSALDKAKQEFGPRDIKNPEIQAALNKQEQALLDLSHTELKAPGEGVITNMDVSVGDYAAAGQPLLTFVSSNGFWLTAMVRENSLMHLKAEDPVKIVFDSYPGEVFKGKVTSIGWGSSGNGSLTVNNASGMFDSPTGSVKAQRFPVNIEFVDLPSELTLRYSGRAVVAFYPDESYLGERLLDVWIWAWSYLSYVS
ncbi:MULTISPECIES: HlyD family secretion protein [Vibrio]|jgi:multidrug resistance efflux pump|uniref:HlyD family secretion protein n=1 Tax=Vibrio TaxID=662 RepID=UPI000E69FC87|nr:HlyD family secretion protein [Vibrio sp. PID23_8]RIZ52642.1 hemolysin D [Vibrio sp. PID23_8]